jgi:UDPglucose 6-dehydrogenase
MRIGVIGLGVVGSAIKTGFEELGHDVLCHDIRLDTTLKSVLKTDICYICVPTPPKEDGSCNIDIVESVVEDLSNISYKGLLIIKSTVEPGTTEKLSDKFPNLRLGFVPEFIVNHDVCIVGVYKKKDFKLVKKSHGYYPKKFVMISPTEAEVCKYFSNIYNATLITFANSFFEVCSKLDVSYDNVKNAIKKRNYINGIYLDCNKNFRGFGGVCLPKDTKAMDTFCKTNGIDVEFFENILKENQKYIITVPKGMRKE